MVAGITCKGGRILGQCCECCESSKPPNLLACPCLHLFSPAMDNSRARSAPGFVCACQADYFLLDRENTGVTTSSNTFEISCPCIPPAGGINASIDYHQDAIQMGSIRDRSLQIQGNTYFSCDYCDLRPSHNEVYEVTTFCAGTYTFCKDQPTKFEAISPSYSPTPFPHTPAPTRRARGSPGLVRRSSKCARSLTPHRALRFTLRSVTQQQRAEERTGTRICTSLLLRAAEV